MKDKPTYTLLNDIHSPEDLRRLSVEQLPEVCRELREDIINELACNPGHFAASLGTVELTVALHYIFRTPEDRIVWDVGHQAYGHKILTGRREQFCTNRKFKGVRPFPSPEESEYDSFTCGHASNSISVGLGMAVAAARKGEKGRRIVAVIGDGSMSGGLAFEGLNNASSTPNDMLIILNDNDMAIDRSVGGMKQYLFNLTTSNRYNQIRFKASRALFKVGLLNENRRKAWIRFSNSLKSMAAQQQNIFEGMNIRYFGPIDGHDVKNIARVLRDIKDMKGPKLLHLHTIKGKGFEPAEKEATVWHAPGKFDPETGERLIDDTQGMPPLFQDVFGYTLLELAEKNKNIVGVTPAMPTGCSMNILMEKMPDRAFDVGIAEGHAVTFSGGMAKDGLQPFCNIYSSFMQRAYDNLIHDVAIQDLPVVLCLDRAGLVGEDGPTHHGVFDLAYLRPIPHLTICSPMDEHELRKLMYTAQLPGKGAFVIRYPRGRGNRVDWRCALEEIPVGKGRKLKEGKDVAVLTIGPIGTLAAEAIALAETAGISVAHYDLRFLKPLDEELLHEIGKRFKAIVTVENGVVRGGMGSAVLEFMADNGYQPLVRRIGVPDHFIEHGSIEELFKVCGMDKESLVQAIADTYKQTGHPPTTENDGESCLRDLPREPAAPLQTNTPHE
ncbi:MAG: 1-deoxy-D-xylulose-5-phosphate synthase [Bacteroides sp.]|nr:1-deoxy-D-xylulose-5-phosphate synthase [Bacteroides sp.]